MTSKLLFLLIIGTTFSQKDEICSKFKKSGTRQPLTYGNAEQICSGLLNYTSFITPEYNTMIHTLQSLSRIPKRQNNIKNNINLENYSGLDNSQKLIDTVQYDRIKADGRSLISQLWDEFNLFLIEGTEACDYINKRSFICMTLFPKCLKSEDLPTETLVKFPEKQFESKIYPITPCREMCLLLESQCVSSINFLEFVTGLKPRPMINCRALPPFKRMENTSPEMKEMCRLGPDTGLIPDFLFSTAFPFIDVTTTVVPITFPPRPKPDPTTKKEVTTTTEKLTPRRETPAPTLGCQNVRRSYRDMVKR